MYPDHSKSIREELRDHLFQISNGSRQSQVGNFIPPGSIITTAVKSREVLNFRVSSTEVYRITVERLDG